MDQVSIRHGRFYFWGYKHINIAICLKMKLILPLGVFGFPPFLTISITIVYDILL